MTIIDVVKSGNFVVLDTETTGLDGFAECCSVAVIDSSGEVLMNNLVRPLRSIPPTATAIHGITNEMVAEEPTFDQIEDELIYLLMNRDVIVYNASYDSRVLKQSSRVRKSTVCWQNHNIRWHCAMEAFAVLYGDWSEYHGSYRWQTLSTAATYYGLPTVGAHGALADCRMTLGVVRAMAQAVQK